MERVVWLQLAASLIVGGGVLWWWGWLVASSVAVGGALIGLNTWSMARVFGLSDVDSPRLYRSAVVRYIGILAGLFILAASGADLLAVMCGMFVAYAAGYILSLNVVLADWKGFRNK